MAKSAILSQISKYEFEWNISQNKIMSCVTIIFTLNVYIYSILQDLRNVYCNYSYLKINMIKCTRMNYQYLFISVRNI